MAMPIIDTRFVLAMTDNNILEHIARIQPTLKRGSLKLAQAVLEDPTFFAHASLAEVGKRAQVSDPTILRFCAMLGCDGFREFKMRMVQSLALGFRSIHSALDSDNDPETVANKILDYTISSLDITRRKLDRHAVAKAVDLLVRSARIEFFGFGASAIVALDAQQRFPLFGVPCGATADPHRQLITASMLKPGDTVVAISYSGSSRVLIEAVRVARERGASVLVITGSDSPITKFADVVLIAETPEDTNFFTPTTSRLAALVMIDILSTSVSMQRGSAHLQTIQDMKKRLAEQRTSGIL